MPQAALEAIRDEWEDGYRRLEAKAAERALYVQYLTELEIVLDQLRRRLGQTFTLDQLADSYPGADRWAQEALAEHELTRGWPARMTTVIDAAFHVYSRGAVDYRP